MVSSTLPPNESTPARTKSQGAMCVSPTKKDTNDHAFLYEKR